MKDFANVRNRCNDPTWLYHGWSNERRHNLLFDLAPIAKRHSLFGVGNIVSVRDYAKIMPKEGKELLRHPYYLALIGFLAEILLQTHNRFCDFSKEKLTFLFDVNDELSPRTMEIFQRVKRESDADARMGDIAFVNDTERLPLQAADLLAYRVRQQLTRLVGHTRAEAKELDDALGLSSRKKHVQMCGANETFLRHMVARIKAENRPWDWDAKPPERLA